MRPIIYFFLKIFLLASLFLLIIIGIFLFAKISNIKINTDINIDKKKTEAVKEQSPKDNLNIINPIYSYEIIDRAPSPELNIGEISILFVKIKNTGNAIWFKKGDNPFYLGTSHPENRESIFYRAENSGWYSGNRIYMKENVIYPKQTANFIFQIKAPDKSGIYREYFSPLIEYKNWINYEEIYWDIKVKDPNDPGKNLLTIINGEPLKSIKIKLGEQKLYAYEENILKYDFITSTGKEGTDTPTGKFAIYNKYATAYSKPYDLYMDNWMAITPDGKYGVHSLPYWLLKAGGRLYEGEDHLGTKVSNGCIRLSVEESKILYDWAEVGIPVYIEN